MTRRMQTHRIWRLFALTGLMALAIGFHVQCSSDKAEKNSSDRKAEASNSSNGSKDFDGLAFPESGIRFVAPVTQQYDPPSDVVVYTGGFDGVGHLLRALPSDKPLAELAAEPDGVKPDAVTINVRKIRVGGQEAYMGVYTLRNGTVLGSSTFWRAPESTPSAGKTFQMRFTGMFPGDPLETMQKILGSVEHIDAQGNPID